MSLSKRLFDIFFSLFLIIIISPFLFAIAICVIIFDGRPAFYTSGRMKTTCEEFMLFKFRTMRNSTENSGVTGGDKSSRITPIGKILRKYRLDELPQLWNILKGDMSFVGPRPPLREYVLKNKELYEEVLKDRPGVTGLASLCFHKTEERILSRTSTPEETEHAYSTICIPRKAKYDLLYQRNQSLCFDLKIMFKTIIKVIR